MSDNVEKRFETDTLLLSLFVGCYIDCKIMHGMIIMKPDSSVVGPYSPVKILPKLSQLSYLLPK